MLVRPSKTAYSSGTIPVSMNSSSASAGFWRMRRFTSPSFPSLMTSKISFALALLLALGMAGWARVHVRVLMCGLAASSCGDVCASGNVVNELSTKDKLFVVSSSWRFLRAFIRYSSFRMSFHI